MGKRNSSPRSREGNRTAHMSQSDARTAVPSSPGASGPHTPQAKVDDPYRNLADFLATYRMLMEKALEKHGPAGIIAIATRRGIKVESDVGPGLNAEPTQAPAEPPAPSRGGSTRAPR